MLAVSCQPQQVTVNGIRVCQRSGAAADDPRLFLVARSYHEVILCTGKAFSDMLLMDMIRLHDWQALCLHSERVLCFCRWDYDGNYPGVKCIYICVLFLSERAQVEKLTDNTAEFDAEEHISLGFYLPDRRAILQCLTLEGNFLVSNIDVTLIIVILNLCRLTGKAWKILHRMKSIM